VFVLCTSENIGIRLGVVSVPVFYTTLSLLYKNHKFLDTLHYPFFCKYKKQLQCFRNWFHICHQVKRWEGTSLDCPMRQSYSQFLRRFSPTFLPEDKNRACFQYTVLNFSILNAGQWTKLNWVALYAATWRKQNHVQKEVNGRLNLGNVSYQWVQNLVCLSTITT